MFVGDRLETCPTDQRADRVALERLAGWCEQFSPLVGLETSEAPSCLFLDITGSAARLGGEVCLAQSLVAALSQRGYLVRAAVADTLGAAWGVVHFKDESDNEFGAREGLFILPPAQHPAALAPLPVEALRLDSQTVELLHQLGVRSISQLLKLPRAGLSARFGDQLLVRLDQAMGRIPEPIEAYRTKAPLVIDHVLDHPTDRLTSILSQLDQLLAELCARLREQDLGVVDLECHLVSTCRSSIRIRIGLFRPAVQAGHLRELLRMQLEQKRFPGALASISLRARITARLGEEQSNLLADAPRVVPRQLVRLVDRLSNRLGREAVVGVQLLAEAQPECAFEYRALAGDERGPVKSSSVLVPERDLPAGLRPLRIESPPRSLRAMSIAPDGPPLSFHYQAHQHQVACCWGPERIETGWWRGPPVRRDYYRVEDDHGGRFWLFRDLECGGWYLHGEFV